MNNTFSYKIKVLPDEKEIEIRAGETLLNCLKRNGFEITSTCGGVGSCGTCKLKIKEGASNLPVLNFKEQGLLGNVFFITKERLSCQIVLNGPITIDISEHLNNKK